MTLKVNLETSDVEECSDILGLLVCDIFACEVFRMSAMVLEILQSSSLEFVEPAKKISEGTDVAHFLQCRAYRDIMTFILQLNRAMFPILSPGNEVQMWYMNDSSFVLSKSIVQVQELLRDLEILITEAPPDPGPRRFGNIAFRKWHSLLEERSDNLLENCLAARVPKSALIEIRAYFLGSFGSAVRLDYGSGHELSFLAFLGSLWKVGGFTTATDSTTVENISRGIVIGTVQPYLTLIRNLIQTYTLEPAGSHGVWGLDDHSFLPYILGSAQYGTPISAASSQQNTPTEGSAPDTPDPGEVVNITSVNRLRASNLYFGAIGFVHDVKKGPFWEHSRVLYDISGVRAGWAKINKGMIKMYNAEVLSKFPVVQHFRFGALFSWDLDPTALPVPSSVHTAHQPLKQNGNTATRNAAQGNNGIQAPWASKSTLPSAATLVGTAAPWQRAPIGQGAERGLRMPTHIRPAHARLRDPMADSVHEEGTAPTSMAPPSSATTKAP